MSKPSLKVLQGGGESVDSLRPVLRVLQGMGELSPEVRSVLLDEVGASVTMSGMQGASSGVAVASSFNITHSHGGWIA
jgi:hypothetical protein